MVAAGGAHDGNEDDAVSARSGCLMSARLVPTLIGALLAPACASTESHAPADHCTSAIPDGMARVIVLRSNSALGGAVSIGLNDDGQPIAVLGPGGRVCWLRHAGTAWLTAYFTLAAPHTARDIEVALASGETASLEISIASPWKLLRVGR